MMQTPCGLVTNVIWAPLKMLPETSTARDVQSTRTCRFSVEIFLRNAYNVLLFRLLLQPVVQILRVCVTQATLDTDKLAALLVPLAHTTMCLHSNNAHSAGLIRIMH